MDEDDVDAFHLERLGNMAQVFAHANGHESLVIGDGLRRVQMEIVEGSVRHGPVRLHYKISGFETVEIQTLTVRRFVQFCRTGRFTNGLFPLELRAPRWIMMLQAYDGLAAGASHREIGMGLFGERVAISQWEDGYRTRVQRLIRAAERLVGGGYRDLLCREEEKKGRLGRGRV